MGDMMFEHGWSLGSVVAKWSVTPGWLLARGFQLPTLLPHLDITVTKSAESTLSC